MGKIPYYVSASNSHSLNMKKLLLVKKSYYQLPLLFLAQILSSFAANLLINCLTIHYHTQKQRKIKL